MSNQCYVCGGPSGQCDDSSRSVGFTLRPEDEDFAERQGLYLIQSTPELRRELQLRRLECQDGANRESLVMYRGEYVDLDDAPEFDPPILGYITARASEWDFPLPPCPDCGGSVVWAEAGYVPGARACIACGSVFVLCVHHVRDSRGEKPASVLDDRVMSLLDDAQNGHLPSNIRERASKLWQRRNTCPDVAVPAVSTMMIDLVWPFAANQKEGK